MDITTLAHAIAENGITAHEQDLAALAASHGAGLLGDWALVLDRTLPPVVRERLFGRLERLPPHDSAEARRAA